MGDKARRLICPPGVAKLVPEALARQYALFPLRCSRGILKVAVATPLSDDAQDTLRFVLNLEVRETLYPAELIRRSLDELYGTPVEHEESIYYCPQLREILRDGTIVIKTSGYTRYGSHWTGWTEVPPDDPDFPFWTWLLAQESRSEIIISGTEIDAIRQDYQRMI